MKCASDVSILFVGGGLANGLAALRMVMRRPEVSVQVLEQGSELGSGHTWCCHGADLTGEFSWLQPLLSSSWSAYDVRFPGYERTFRGSYHALRSPKFHSYLTEVLADRVRTLASVDRVEADGVVLANGERLTADCVVDGRGLPPDGLGPCAYQKFYGLFVTTATPHGLVRPLLMDATVPQVGGFRFVYLLPWSERELLVEDTCYSESPTLDPKARRLDLLAYLQRQGFRAFAVTGDEQGALPIPLYGASAPTAASGVVMAGVRAGLFHPTTGYSLPEAARFADWLASRQDFVGPVVARAAAQRAEAVWRRGSYCRRLNSMLFMAAAPAARRSIMAQFYRRDAGLIARFYSGSLTVLDRMRLLSGRPPCQLLLV